MSDPVPEAVKGVEVSSAEQPQVRTSRRVQPRHADLGPWWREGFLLRAAAALVASIVLAAAVRHFVAAPFRVETASMQPAISQGDVVVGLRNGEPTRGDVVSFTTPQSWVEARGGGSATGTSVARVIGTAGDEVRCCDNQSRLVINGISLSAAAEPQPTRFRVVVPQGRLFVRSEDPSVGVDSRCFLHSLGTESLVPVDSVEARLSTVIWPVGHWGQVSGREVLQAIGTSSPPPAQAVVEAASDANC